MPLQEDLCAYDSAVMREMDAIISLTSAAMHVVTICQGLGIPALLSLEKNGVDLQPEAGASINSDGWKSEREIGSRFPRGDAPSTRERRSSSRAGCCAT